MPNSELLEPEQDETNINKTKDLTDIINNHINNSVLLFNLQTKFNNEIYKKLETKEILEEKSDNNLILKLLDKTLNNHILLLSLNDKINDYLLFSTVFMGIGFISIGYVFLCKKLKN
jgi:hypothetical protein